MHDKSWWDDMCMWACSIFDAFCSLRAFPQGFPMLEGNSELFWALRSALSFRGPQNRLQLLKVRRWEKSRDEIIPIHLVIHETSWNHHEIIPWPQVGLSCFVMFCHVLSQVDSISEVVHPFGSVSFAPGFRILPRLFGTSRGLPEESKNLSQSTRWAGKMNPHMHSVYL